MENQHRHIRGHRDLTEAEIAAMNTIKDHAEQTRALIEQAREAGAEPRWLAIATTELQQGFMALTRAVAKPASF